MTSCNIILFDPTREGLHFYKYALLHLAGIFMLCRKSSAPIIFSYTLPLIIFLHTLSFDLHHYLANHWRVASPPETYYYCPRFSRRVTEAAICKKIQL